MPSQSVTPVSDALPTDGFLRLLEIGLSSNQAFAISRGSHDASARHLGLTVAFLAGDGPVHLSDPGKAIGPTNILRVRPGCAGDTTRRLAAHFPWISTTRFIFASSASAHSARRVNAAIC